MGPVLRKEAYSSEREEVLLLRRGTAAGVVTRRDAARDACCM